MRTVDLESVEGVAEALELLSFKGFEALEIVEDRREDWKEAADILVMRFLF